MYGSVPNVPGSYFEPTGSKKEKKNGVRKNDKTGAGINAWHW